MKEAETFDRIAPEAFESILETYSHVVPEKLASLDEQRYILIPAALKGRQEEKSLTKSEVVELVNWKLSHGKWRPMLQGLVQRNAETFIQEVTATAFETWSSASKSSADVKPVINGLAELQGIGPATASLLLSVFDPENVPFFSDELFRWCFYQDTQGCGWEREIKYNIKEYVELYAKVNDFRNRFQKDYNKAVSATDIERVAYVLGKAAARSAMPTSSRKRKAETKDDASVSKTSTTDADGRNKVGKVDTSKSSNDAAPTISQHKAGKSKPSPPNVTTTAAASRPKRTKA